jgi:hypothetical protein
MVAVILACDSADRPLDLLPQVRAYGLDPQAWGCYITGPFAADRATIDGLHNEGLCVFLIYPGATPESVCGDFSVGQADGKKAVEAAERLGAPHGVTIFVDVEASWCPSAEWASGWAKAVRDSHYVPGFYGSPYTEPFVNAVSSVFATGVQIWSAEPERGFRQGDSLPAWEAATVKNRPASVWQFAENVVVGPSGQAVDLDLIRTEATNLWLPWPFSDVQPGAWYARDVWRVVRLGLMNGVELHRFAPNAALTRAEMATILARLYEHKELVVDAGSVR